MSKTLPTDSIYIYIYVFTLTKSFHVHHQVLSIDVLIMKSITQYRCSDCSWRVSSKKRFVTQRDPLFISHVKECKMTANGRTNVMLTH